MEIRKAAVVGAGLMGHGIAMILAKASCQVTMMDLTDEILERAHQRIRNNLEALLRHEMLTPPEAAQIQNGITSTTSLAAAVSEADFVVEAVFERLPLKEEVFANLDRLCPSHAILASNTSGMPITRLASATQRPDKVVGSHFIMPAHVMPLVEVIRGEKTSDETMKTTYELWQRGGKDPVMVNKDIPGFLHNRLQHAITREAIAMLQMGAASAEDIDKVATRGFGLRVGTTGPLAQRDMAGLDLHYSIASYLYRALDTSPEPHPYLKEKVARGELGLKTGRGFYDWEGKNVEEVLRQEFEDLIENVKALYYRKKH